ncbi:MAG: hypothetical protein CR964_00150 [Rhodobacterales bacterium]|nr:MAG: hypothetical protein CR964_00150 [Rhodobacterales bacterium]
MPKVDPSTATFQTDFPQEAYLNALGIPSPAAPPDYIVEGTSGDDWIDVNYTGDPEGDMVDHGDNQAGNDDDVIQAGDGNDTVKAGAGNDTIMGGAGTDVLYGGDGDDTIYGGADSDAISTLSSAGLRALTWLAVKAAMTMTRWICAVWGRCKSPMIRRTPKMVS